MQRSDVIAEAREWIGTPYAHQHRAKGVGCDCVGLIVGVGLATGSLTTWTPEKWREVKRYGRLPNPTHMGGALAQFLLPVDGAGVPEDGAIAWLGWRAGLPMHLAFIATSPDGYRTIIHAYSLADRVVENRLSDEWLTRVESWWRFPKE